MLGISTINTAGFRSFEKGIAGNRKKATTSNCSVLNMRQCNGTRSRKNSSRKNVQQINLKLELKSACFILAATVVFSGAFYLYQVNDLASKGYELRDLQDRVATLQATNKKGTIQEVELMSMYNIEKVTQNLDLVNMSDVKYLELNSPVAMK